MDKYGSPNKSIGIGEWYFRTIAQPVVVSFDPPDGSINVKADKDLSLTFSRPVLPGIAVELFVFENGVIRETYGINDASVELKGNQVIISRNTPFTKGSHISVGFQSGFVWDIFGIPIDQLDSSAWTFNIEKETSLSTVQSNLSGITAFPNPTDEEVVIRSDMEIHSIELFRITGQKIPITISMQSENAFKIKPLVPFSGVCMVCVNGTMRLLQVFN
jgi:hypothetical protein